MLLYFIIRTFMVSSSRLMWFSIHSVCILSDITAWSPTFAIIIYKKLKPNTKIKSSLKYCFKGKLKKLFLFLTSGFIMLGGTFGSLGIVSFIEKKKPFPSYFSLGGYNFYYIFLSFTLFWTYRPRIRIERIF